MEVSNPNMHTIHLLRELGANESALAAANKRLFALLFFVCRLLVGPFVVYATLRSSTTPLVVKAGGLGILLVSLLWFRKARYPTRPHSAAAVTHARGTQIIAVALRPAKGSKAKKPRKEA